MPNAPPRGRAPAVGTSEPLEFMRKEPNYSDITMGNVVNAPAIGLLTLDEKGEPIDCSVVLADGKRIQFIQD